MLIPSTVHNAWPQAKSYALRDERGMYLLVKPNGSRWSLGVRDSSCLDSALADVALYG
jgi:hypothetical protein